MEGNPQFKVIWYLRHFIILVMFTKYLQSLYIVFMCVSSNINIFTYIFTALFHKDFSGVLVFLFC